MNQDTIAVIGTGSWGTALSIVLADNGYKVKQWGRSKETIEEINQKHTNEKYIKNVELPVNIIGHSDLRETLEGVKTIILAVPTKAMREVLAKIQEVQQGSLTVVHVSKGVEPDSLLRISEIIEDAMKPENLEEIVVLSGPSHAEEVSLRHPTTVVAASKDIEASKMVQSLFMNSYFRVYTNTDIVGVEIGGALKNIIALAAGVGDGLGYGDNAKAALITRGLVEISRLGVKMGANPLTFSGLSGIGDLIVTCTSVHSRNWRAGNMLGKGMNLDEVLDNMGMVVEGVRTTKAAKQLAAEYGVSMPITDALYDILFNSVDAREAVDQLMQRNKTHEMEDLVVLLGDALEEE
ncbi:NAD(P)H-dependent glycerol-3-phosphate dehydrogenase [[Bacillus] enclensis]|uniref:NAD(P)H-dependent glycerol-3-phosphate dehydrogenase n=1 Tax=[Bacillus] enclensis TaxID=1402860 RepID=UPI0018DE6883|nr:NAD(P)H-dependent glycerol-3-phosphate dehydrogenase [[Bacillus] enclensis]MBH9966623.1 NAD(P)H-dependent glycerol-3-phosphate dehydrogenase [[Bacillus] enclensis]